MFSKSEWADGEQLNKDMESQALEFRFYPVDSWEAG